MAQFTANRGSFLPVAHATQVDNWVLTVLTVGMSSKVKMFGWGGRSTTSTGYRTRWGRVNNTAATTTALTVTSNNPNATSMASVNSYATQATIAADPTGLWAQDWNSLGGGGVIILPIGGEWLVVGGALGTLFNQIGCWNIAGAESSGSSYGVTYEE